MDIYEKGEYERLIHLLQDRHLEMNEYKKQYDCVPVEDYIDLLDMIIEQVKCERDNIKWRDETLEKYKVMLEKCQGMLLGKLQNF